MSQDDAATKRKSSLPRVMTPRVMTLPRSMSKMLERARRSTSNIWTESESRMGLKSSAAPVVPTAHKNEIKNGDDHYNRHLEQLLVKNVDADPQWFFIHREFSRGVTPQTVTIQADESPSMPLHEHFNSAEVHAWDPDRFELVQKLQDAVRNQGEVLLMRDRASNAQVAVKRMPAAWVGSSHEDFLVRHPDESEKPWQDIGCARLLNNIGYQYACQLLGVFRNEQHTYVVSSFATEGDLHTWCSSGPPPSLQSEHDKQPICVEILRAIQQLHDSSVVHGDVSLENILLSRPTSSCTDGNDNASNDRGPQVRVIDFGVASTSRHLKYRGGGRTSYHAPEVYSREDYDGFLADAFSLGVVLYAVMTRDYPWLSTQPGSCPRWGYVQNFGLRAYFDKRRINDGAATVTEVLSEPLVRLLEGLLAPDPKARLTLGELSFASCGRRSVWDEQWAATIRTTL